MQNQVWQIRSMMQLCRHLFTILILLLLPAPAWSQSNQDRASEVLARADLNRDGQVTRSELKSSRAKTFERLDRNKDQLINTKDRPAPPFTKRFDDAVARLLPEFDANRDGNVSRKEFVDGPTTGFDAADLNKDGVLSAAEISKMTVATE
jgi:Ca2+-binding EF-hand superfamily protein